MSATNLYSLNSSMLTSLGSGQPASDALTRYQSFVKYMIAAQQEAFLENTISSTYVLLNASNYSAIAETYKRQTDVYATERDFIRRTQARVVDRSAAARWDGTDSSARSAALAAFAVGVPVAGIAYENGSANGAAGVVALTAAVAAVSYAVATARTHRDSDKVYWAPMPSTTIA